MILDVSGAAALSSASSTAATAFGTAAATTAASGVSGRFSSNKDTRAYDDGNVKVCSDVGNFDAAEYRGRRRERKRKLSSLFVGSTTTTTSAAISSGHQCRR